MIIQSIKKDHAQEIAWKKKQKQIQKKRNHNFLLNYIQLLHIVFLISGF